MLDNAGPVVQTALGTLFTWGMTAVGAGLVFCFKGGQRKLLDGSLGFAAGVMMAASYWSLLEPALDMAEHSGSYGDQGQWAFVPVALGFLLGAAFVYGADIIIPDMDDSSSSLALALESDLKNEGSTPSTDPPRKSDIQGGLRTVGHDHQSADLKRRGASKSSGQEEDNYVSSSSLSSSPSLPSSLSSSDKKHSSWHRILLLIIAITIHNIPEGLAVGVAFGAVGKSKTATFDSARNLAFGIGIQNFPEGLAVSLPLRASGMSLWKSFWYGQLSGVVEPVAGMLGVVAVVLMEPVLPYALAFAAGAMIYVVVDDILPEAHAGGNGKLASCCAVLGFIVMMALDVGLG